jgi:cell division protein FtsI (penicillin-binding protein 3)
MYQAMANDGVRIPPRILKATIAPDGTRTEEERPEGVRVVSPETARTVRNMFRAIVQRDPMGEQQGTGPGAAVEGYQIAGKTGTAQQINPACGCYYSDVYWITFAGMATVDDPRYVIGIMMDAPHRAADGSPGSSAAPLFHNIASWLLQRENVPLSPPGAPLTLQAT